MPWNATVAGYGSSPDVRASAVPLPRIGAFVKTASSLAVTALLVLGAPLAAQAVVRTQQWGAPGDIPVPGRYLPGETKADFAIWRPSSNTFAVFPSSGAASFALPLGGSPVVGRSWIPVPADYDGDGAADLGLYINGSWRWRTLSATQSGGGSWGISGDIPVPGKYDNHPSAAADLAVYRPSTQQWFVLDSVTNVGSSVRWGRPGDIPDPAAFSCNGLLQPTIFRPTDGTWWILKPGGTTSLTVQWGATGDVPVANDYVGDPGPDVTVWRPSTGTWYSSDLAPFGLVQSTCTPPGI